MSALLLRLREVRHRRRTFWHVEVWKAGSLASLSTHADRPTARRIARGLAGDLGAVVVLAGPDTEPSLTSVRAAKGGAA